MGTIADKEISSHLNARRTKRIHFLQECHGIEHHAVADHTASACAQYSTRNQLEDELPPIDDDRVPGVMPAGIARDNGKILREHVDNFAFALVAPLGSNYTRSFSSIQNASSQMMAQLSRPQSGVAHTLPAKTRVTELQG